MEENKFSTRNLRQAAIYDGDGGRQLDLSRQNLQRLPATLFAITDLRLLDISDNPLGKLPISLSKLNKMQKLSALQCGLTKFPKEAVGKTQCTIRQQPMILYMGEI